MGKNNSLEDSIFKDNLYRNELVSAKSAAISAGEEIITVSTSGDFGIKEKNVNKFVGEDDLDIVTRADRNSSIEICKRLITDFPDYGLLCEEDVESFDVFLKDKMFRGKLRNSIAEWNKREFSWIIDPLDGTKDFVKGSDQVGINIALIKKGEPVLGVVYLPLKKLMYWAIIGKGAYREDMRTGNIEKLSVSGNRDIYSAIVTYSISNKDPVLNGLIENVDFYDVKRYAGPGLKLAKIAEGEVDMYLCFNGVPDTWDVCAGDMILLEAGGCLTDKAGNRFNYLNGSVLDNGIVGSNCCFHNDFIKKYLN